MPHQDSGGVDLTAGRRERGLARGLFFLGASALIAQTLAIREILALAGGSEHILGVAFTLWFFWSGAGALLAGFARRLHPLAPGTWAAVLTSGATWLPLAQVLLLRFFAGWLETSDGRLTGTWPAAAALLVLLAPVPLALGALLSTAAVCETAAAQPGSSVAGRLAWDALGAAAAGAVFTFVLAGRWPPLQIALLLPAAGGALALWQSLQPGASRKARLALVLAAPGCAASATLLYLNREADLERCTFAWRPRFTERRERVLQTKDSRYQQLVLTEYRGQFTVYGNGEPAAVYPDAEASAADAHLAACLAPEPRHILLAGGVSGSALAALLRHRPERLDVVECDLEVLALLRDKFSDADRKAFEDPAVRVAEADVTAFLLAAPPGCYDLVWLHPPPPASLLNNRCYTQEFFQRVARAASPRGVLTFTTLGAPNYLSPQLGAYLASIRAALRASFPEVREFPGGSERFVCAQRAGVLPEGPDEAVARFRKRNMDAPGFAPESFYLSWEPEQVRKREEDLSALASAQPNRDLEPRAMAAYLRVRELLAHGPDAAAASGQTESPLASRWVFAFLIFTLLAALLARYVYRKRHPDDRPGGLYGSVALAVLAGAGGIALELALLNAFQAGCGFVYERIGLISSVYLLGFAAGSRWAARLLRAPASVFRWLCLATCAQPILVLLAWFATGPLWPFWSPGGIQALTFVLLGAFSFVAGLQLPLLAPAALHGSGQRSSWSKLLTGDLAGATLGSFLLGTVVLPRYGTREMLGFLAVALLAGLVLLPRSRQVSAPAKAKPACENKRSSESP